MSKHQTTSVTGFYNNLDLGDGHFCKNCLDTAQSAALRHYAGVGGPRTQDAFDSLCESISTAVTEALEVYQARTECDDLTAMIHGFAALHAYNVTTLDDVAGENTPMGRAVYLSQLYDLMVIGTIGQTGINQVLEGISEPESGAGCVAAIQQGVFAPLDIETVCNTMVDAHMGDQEADLPTGNPVQSDLDNLIAEASSLPHSPMREVIMDKIKHLADAEGLVFNDPAAKSNPTGVTAHKLGDKVGALEYPEGATPTVEQVADDLIRVVQEQGGPDLTPRRDALVQTLRAQANPDGTMQMGSFMLRAG